MSAAIVSLVESNHRDPVAEMRRIADRIESGEFGAVGCVAIVLLGDTMEVFGMGEDSTPPSVGVLLHAGFLRMSRAIEEHGREE